MEKETSPPVPVISSVLTLASGPPITKPIKLNPGNNISDDEERYLCYIIIYMIYPINLMYCT